MACDNPITCTVDGVTDAINGAAGAVNYWSDPWGNTYKALQDSAASLAKDILPALTQATLPDLTLDWFISAYRISFAAAILAVVVLLIPQFLRTARGTQSGRDTAESVTLYFPLFLTGAMFGPPFGMVLVNFFHALSDAFASWGILGSVDTIGARFDAIIKDGDYTGLAGGIPVAAVMMFLMLVALLMVLLVLIVQLVTLYFAGVLVPLGLLWIVDPQRRDFGKKLIGVWIGILAAHPLLFFLLGFAFNMSAGSVNVFGNSASLEKLVQFIVAIIALFIAALSPLILMKFAPVIPVGSGGTNGPSMQPGSWGSNNMSDATNKYQPQSTSGTSEPQTQAQSTPASSDDASQPASGGGGLGEAAATRAAGSKAAATGGEEAAVTSGATTTGAAAGAAGASTAAEGAAAAGAAESSTGVGAIVGVPTLIAAAGMAAGSKVVEVTQVAGDQATSAMDEESGN